MKFYLIALVVVLIDIVTKQLFGKIKNYGAAFGILKGYNGLFIIVSFIVIFCLIYYYLKKDSNVIGFGFLLGGVTGNLIDRLVFGYVRDFIRIGIYPAFNIADIANVIGVLIIILYWNKAK